MISNKYFVSQVMKPPCTSLCRSRSLSTGTSSWDVSLSFSHNVFYGDTDRCFPAQLSVRGRLYAREDLCQTLWLTTKSGFTNCCMSYSADRDWLTSNVLAATSQRCDFTSVCSLTKKLVSTKSWCSLTSQTRTKVMSSNCLKNVFLLIL